MPKDLRRTKIDSKNSPMPFSNHSTHLCPSQIFGFHLNALLHRAKKLFENARPLPLTHSPLSFPLSPLRPDRRDCLKAPEGRVTRVPNRSKIAVKVRDSCN